MSHDFHPLRIAQVRRETADTMSIALAVPPELTDAYRFRPGQHLVVRSMLDGAEMRRTYSISSGPDDNELWLTIKRVDGGQFSSHAHQHFKPGSTIEAMPPAGRFVVPPPNGRARSFVAIAAGSGITPVMAMIRQVLAAEPESRFTLIYGNRSFDSIIFREALADLKDRYLDRLMVVHVLSREADADVPELSGHIDAAKVEHFLTSLVSVRDVDQFFLCGPGSLIKDAFQQLKAMGVPRERVHFEYFKAGPEVAERPSRPAPQPDEQRPPGRRAGGSDDRWRPLCFPGAAGRARGRRGDRRRRAGALLVQGRDVLHVPGEAGRGQRRDDPQLLAGAVGDRCRLRAHLPVASDLGPHRPRLRPAVRLRR